MINCGFTGGSMVERMNAGRERIVNIESEHRIDRNGGSANFEFKISFATYSNGMQFICNPVLVTSEGKVREYKINVYLDLMHSRCKTADEKFVFEKFVNLDLWWRIYTFLNRYYWNSCVHDTYPENNDYNSVINILSEIVTQEVKCIDNIRFAIKLSDAFDGKCLVYWTFDNERCDEFTKETIVKKTIK